MTALFGEYLNNKGTSLQALVKTTPGGFNGLLYQARVIKSGLYEVTSGDNNVTNSTCSICTAGAGYDNVTALFANY